MDDSLEGLGTELVGILACILIGATFAAVNHGIVAYGELRLRATREGNDKNALTAARFLEMGATIQARLFTGRVLCISSAATLAVHSSYGKFGSFWVSVGSILVVALVYAIVAGTVAEFVARRASRFALLLLRLCYPLELLMIPFAIPLIGVSSLVKRIFPARPEDDPDRITEMDVGQMIEQGEVHGSITEEHADLLRSVLEFSDTIVREVMVPRTKMVAIDIETPLCDVARLIVEKGHSRYPVFRTVIDQIEGVLYAKDLFKVIREQGGMDGQLADLVRRPVFFAAESQKISEILREMQSSRVHLSVVIDEFGGTSGMVTLEDIIEEIVGEIRDEHDFEEVPTQQISKGHYIANAEVSVYDFAELTGIELPEEAGTYDSLGGLVVDLMGYVPRKGESVQFGTYDFIIKEADERHVTRVEIVRRSEEPPTHEESLNHK